MALLSGMLPVVAVTVAEVLDDPSTTLVATAALVALCAPTVGVVDGCASARTDEAASESATLAVGSSRGHDNGKFPIAVGVVGRDACPIKCGEDKKY